jgi:predicted Rossmann fold nucleotide-binding protein DprA/Smf involved in DNA uptake
MIQSSDIQEIIPSAGLEGFFRGRPRKLWGIGNAAILGAPLLGIISARQVNSDLASISSQLLEQLACLNEAAFIGGWHSPLEKEALQILLAKTVPIVLCIPKALNRFVPTVDVDNRVSQGQALLLTHCSPRVKRISRDASIRRNQLVISLATALLVLSAPPGSVSFELAKSALRRGKPVLTPEHLVNKELFKCEGLSATIDNVRAALGY